MVKRASRLWPPRRVLPLEDNAPRRATVGIAAGVIAMRRFAVIAPRFRSTRRWFASCTAVLLTILTAGTAAAATTPSPAPAGDPAVISDWNAIAVTTLAADTTNQPVADLLSMGFVQAAVMH